MIQSENFWDKKADSYSKVPVKNEAAYQKKLQITRGYFKPHTKVFEFACGTGSTAISHAPYVDHILAIDISSKMLAIAKEKADAAKVENVSFQQSTIEGFNQPDESFDVVMGHSIIHLLKAPDAVIAKAYELLKPGGVLVTNTVCLGDSKIPWRPILAIAQIFGMAPFANIIKRRELEQLFLNAGFEIDYRLESQETKGVFKGVFIILKKPANEE